MSFCRTCHALDGEIRNHTGYIGRLIRRERHTDVTKAKVLAEKALLDKAKGNLREHKEAEHAA